MKITKEAVEAGLRAEWAKFTEGSSKPNTWPDGCPPSARDRWRKALTAGLRAAIRASKKRPPREGGTVKISLATQDKRVTHRRYDFMFMGKRGYDRARTVCGLRIFYRRIYPLVWTDSERMVSCSRCRPPRKKSEDRPEGGL